MSWRIVSVSSISKLDLKLNYLVVRTENKTTKIHLSEISILIVENTAVSITAAILNEMIKRKIKIIFCDEKRNPSFELIAYYGSVDTSLKIRSQIKWDEETKILVWTYIVKEKIKNQTKLIGKFGLRNFELLKSYIDQVVFNDEENREAYAAKVYFNSLFGNSFSRSNTCSINAALNYGYMVMLSAFNREIVASGYLTMIGLHHKSMFNQFNLSCDFIEPFRVLVDEVVYKNKPDKFEKEEKIMMLNVLNSKVKIDGKEQYVNNAIRIYVNSIFEALEEKDVSKIKFFEYEL